MHFVPSALLLAFCLAGAAFLFGYASRRWPGLHSALPRHRLAGTLLGALCLIWAAVHANAMLEGDLARFRIIVKALVPVVVVLAYFHLDYLLARALGGLLLLLVNHVLQAGFAAQVPWRPVFSTVCYIVGIAGMFLVAVPWRLRDGIGLSADSAKWRLALCLGSGIAALVIAGLALARLAS